MRVFLLHGMGRTPTSMWVLARRLKAAGYRPSLFGYFVTAADLADIYGRFQHHVKRVLAADREAVGGEMPWAVVGHSLGGIITRLASPELPGGWRAFVMLAPPNRPPAMATALRDNPIFRFVTRDAGRKLTDPAFYEGMPRPDVPTLVVAGTRGPRDPRLPFKGAVNDSVVSLAETRLEGARTLEIPAVHTFLMNRADVFAAIREFFAQQGFTPCQEGIA
jgi:pimeloyl-ACP methyl ester carboxylesterase